MLKLLFTNDSIEGEPGPNLYLKGSTGDFSKLKDLISHMSISQKSISLKEAHVLETSGKDIIMSCEANKRVLSKIDDENVYMNLDSKYWNEIIAKTDLLSNSKGFNYIEFDSDEMIEDANLIWSSEYQYFNNVALNGFDVAPSIISLMYMEYLGK